MSTRESNCIPTESSIPGPKPWTAIFFTSALCVLLLNVPLQAFASIIVNAAGSGGAPVSITTSSAVQVIAADGGRVNWSLESEGGDLRCAFGDALGNAPSPEPTSTIGFLIPYVKGQLWKEAGANARYRVDCIAVSATTSVDTAEEK